MVDLAASAVERRRSPSRVGRSRPEPVPLIRLGQLAVDTRYRGRGLGSDLLIDAAVDGEPGSLHGSFTGG